MTIFKLPEYLCGYIGSAFVATILIRLTLSLLRCWSQHSPWSPKYLYWLILRGYGAGKETDDYLLPAIVGLLELLVYPVLFAAGKPEYIGAWLGLKVVPQLGLWTTNREHYQRFLIGNALAIVCSYGLQLWFYPEYAPHETQAHVFIWHCIAK